MRLKAFLSVSLIVGVALPFAALAQQAPRPATASPGGVSLAPGARVRVKATHLVAPLVANYLETRGDTLVFFEESAGRGVWTFAFDQVERLEIAIGDRPGHRSHITRGAAFGGGGGALAGLIFASTFDPSDPERKYSRPLTMLVGGVIGAGIGAYLAWRVLDEAWSPIPLPRRVSLLPDSQGRLHLTLGF